MLVVIETHELALMITGIVEEKIKPIRDKILHAPDETVLSDEEAACRIKKSVSTLRRMKADGRINSISTPKGRMCRVCDVTGEKHDSDRKV